MTFTFRGSRAELAQRIEAAAKAEGRDIYIGGNYPDHMEIGFERHGHQGGRFFYAAITEAEGVLTLTGEAEDSHRHRMSGGQRLWNSLSGWLGGFALMAFCAVMLWVVAEDLGISPLPFWIALLIPTVWLLSRIPRSRREQRKTDDDFYDFLSRTMRA